MENMMKQISSARLLRRLEELFEVHEIKYDILSQQFEYMQHGNMTYINIEDLAKHIYFEDEETDVISELQAAVNSGFPDYFKNQLIQFYNTYNIPLPPHIYVFKEMIQFIDADGDMYYVPFSSDLSLIFKQFSKIIGVEHISPM